MKSQREVGGVIDLSTGKTSIEFYEIFKKQK